MHNLLHINCVVQGFPRHVEAKIEDLQSHFIGWTSSVFVALALPDLYFIAAWRDDAVSTERSERGTNAPRKGRNGGLFF